jgi:hypothetical protein
MFQFTRKPSSGSHRQYSAKTTHLVQCGYTELVQDIVSVMAAYYECNKTIRTHVSQGKSYFISYLSKCF